MQGEWRKHSDGRMEYVLDLDAYDAESRQKTAEAYAQGRLRHTRNKSWCRQELIYVYVYDPVSPTGVVLLTTMRDNPENEAFLRDLANWLVPLGPNER